MMSRSYSEMIRLKSFEDRYNYLKLNGTVGNATFGSSRWLNQVLYNSKEWKDFRRRIILRDSANGYICDLGAEDHPISGYPLVHHINPITKEMVVNRDPCIFDPDNVITTSHRTHEAIHYGDEDLIYKDPIERTPNDTCPWRKVKSRERR